MFVPKPNIFLLFAITCLTLDANAKDRLLRGESLSNNQYISSPNGKYSLVMQSDGSLVMYRNDGSVRYSMKKRGTVAIMQTDNNFVEYRGKDPLWSTGTANTRACIWPCFLRIHDNGDLGIEWQNPSGSMGGGAWKLGPDPVPAPGPIYPLTVLVPPGPAPTSPPPFPRRPEIDNTILNNLDPRH